MDLPPGPLSGPLQEDHLPVVLCVDDEPQMLSAIQRVFLDFPGECELLTVTSGEAALEVLRERDCDLAIVDLHMPGMSGLELLGQLSVVAPDTEAIVLTAIDDTETVVQVMKAGASDYLTKPYDGQRLLTTVGNLLQKRRLVEQNRRLRSALRERQVRRFLGRSPAAQKVLQRVKQASRVRSHVLIVGESGTGKEVVARNIHYFGPNADQPFVAVDCTAISPNLFESELFGHVKGAFTGAHGSSEGLMRSARNGTLFLDEVTEMPVTMQAKLLRAIQEKEVRPVGSSQFYPFGGRVLAATNRDLAAMMEAGQFRQDLYYRLNVIPMKIPPLRQRREDIPLLVKHFMALHGTEGEAPRQISDDAMDALTHHDWPGNVRELENCIERICALSARSLIGLGDLPEQVAGSSQAGSTLNLSGYRQDVERQAILEALERAGGNRSAAARLLGLGRSTLYRKLEQLGIPSRPQRG